MRVLGVNSQGSCMSHISTISCRKSLQRKETLYLREVEVIMIVVRRQGQEDN